MQNDYVFDNDLELVIVKSVPSWQDPPPTTKGQILMSKKKKRDYGWIVYVILAVVIAAGSYIFVSTYLP